VLEDLARFVLRDAGLARRWRALRHGLDAALRAVPFAAELLPARDSARDVGREDYRGRGVAGPRRSLRDLATANARRLEEAARVLEEHLRCAGQPNAAAAARAARFSAYRLEQELVAGLPAPRLLPDPCLYVIVTEALARLPWERAARLALEGGAAALQLREKTLSDREYARRAERLRRLTRRHGALLFVNDRVDVARMVEADGVHLGADDLAPATARLLLGPAALIGSTSHTLAEAHAARAAGADYVSAGPVYSAASKFRHLEARGERVPVLRPTGLGAIQRVGRTGIPFVAIGGITPENAAAVIRAGARRIAVCAGVMAADDPRAAARRLVRLLRLRRGRR
jgi:thiamine-phosphate pyrophosphorylase